MNATSVGDPARSGPTPKSVPGGDPETSPTRSPWAAHAAERYGLLVVFALVSVGFAIALPETFPTYTNIRTLLSSQAVLAVAAIALISPLIGGRFDISVGANLGLSSIVAAAAMQNHDAPLVVAVLAGVVAGALVGTFNGLLIAYAGVNAIICTLGVSIILAGVVSAYTGGIPLSSGLSPTLTDLSVLVLLGIPMLFVIMLVVAAVAWFVLRQMPYGRRLQAVGGNLEAARLSGIDANRVVLLSFVLSGAFAGVAGVLQIAAQGNADPQTGSLTFILPALAAAFLGATTWQPGSYNVVGTIVGLYFLSVVISGLSLLGVMPWVTDVFNGAAVIIAIVVSAQFRRRRTGSLQVGM